jgi:hypothetical protein
MRYRSLRRVAPTVEELRAELAIAERDERVHDRRADAAYAAGKFAAGRFYVQQSRGDWLNILRIRGRIEAGVTFTGDGFACDDDLEWME